MCLLHFCLCQPVCGLLVRRPALLAVLFCWPFFSFFCGACGLGLVLGALRQRRATVAEKRHQGEDTSCGSTSLPLPPFSIPLSLFVPLLSVSSSCSSLSLSLAHSAQIASVGKATVADQKPSACGMPHAVQPLPPPPATSPLLPAH